MQSPKNKYLTAGVDLMLSNHFILSFFTSIFLGKLVVAYVMSCSAFLLKCSCPIGSVKFDFLVGYLGKLHFFFLK